MLKQVLIWPGPVKRAVVMTVDVILAVLATWSAYSIRMGTFQWPLGAQWFVYVLSPVLAIPIFLRFGLYRTIFRYFGLDALLTTGKAVALYALAFIGLLLWPMWPTFPLTWGILQPIIFFLLVSASRVLAQFWLTGISLVHQTTTSLGFTPCTTSCTPGAKPRRLRSIYKHVPMVECNPSEGIFNNVFGTSNGDSTSNARPEKKMSKIRCIGFVQP